MSSRTRKPVNYAEASDFGGGQRGGRDVEEVWVYVEEEEDTDPENELQARQRSSKRPVSVQAPPEEASSRAQMCDVERICLEDMGQEYEQSGKAFVMQAINQRNACPKFSKYSGVVEWKNAIVLWVNIGHPLFFFSLVHVRVYCCYIPCSPPPLRLISSPCNLLVRGLRLHERIH